MIPTRTLPALAAAAVAAALGLVSPASACPGIDHAHGLEPRAAKVSTQPSGGTSLLRDLTWGDVQIIHTTDIHGWYQGHMKSSQPEPNYSGDWGDFASFVIHMRRLAKKKGVDLLLVDSGDLHDGAGLSDGFPPGGVDAHVSNEFHSMVRYDLLAPGNHELYKYQDAYDTYMNFVPAQNGRYVGSNVFLTYQASNGTNVTAPMGEKYIKFTTDQGRKVTSLGVLFNFTGSDKNITVQPPKEMVKESWFAEAIKEEPDFFLLAGHMPVREDDWPSVVDAIRAVHPTTPILVLGGHTHIRDCTQYDEFSIGLESGRYLETIGWLSAKLPAKRAKKVQGPADGNVTFSRSYIDANRRNYAYHAQLSRKKFDTAKGKKITAGMTDVANRWNLSDVYGVAPQDYYLNRVGVDDEASLINLLTQKVFPTVISTANPDRKDVPNMVFANSGSQRFDLYAGNFTVNDQYIVSPFTDKFQYIRDVPYKYANQIIAKLNTDEEAGANSRRSMSEVEERELYSQGHVSHIFKRWQRDQYASAAARDLAELDARAEKANEQRTLGYVTKDECPGEGDDTQHLAIPFVSVPDYVASPVTRPVGDDDKIDVIFVDFIGKELVRILNGIQTERVYSTDEIVDYADVTTQDMYPLYAKAEWNNGTATV